MILLVKTQKQLIEEVLESIQPRLAMHGGGVELVSFDEKDHVAELRMQGACVGCAMSQMTMRAGIEMLVREKVPGVTIVDVSDHEAGENPYYPKDEDQEDN